MAKVITFSRTFPAYHPKKGQPTYFVEKFLKGRPNTIEKEPWNPEKSLIEQLPLALDIWHELQPKYHTIRAGNRFKAGDYFSPRVWSGNPYNSPQIKIAPDTLIVKTWDFEIDENGVYSINQKYTDENVDEILAKNDGLSEEDLQHWFIPDYNKWNKVFKGQIICWNESINY